MLTLLCGVEPTIRDENVPNKWRGTSLFRESLLETFCCQASDKTRCGNWDDEKLEEIRLARNTPECVYVLAPSMYDSWKSAKNISKKAAG